jgi:hypothetical protein
MDGMWLCSERAFEMRNGAGNLKEKRLECEKGQGPFAGSWPLLGIAGINARFL